MIVSIIGLGLMGGSLGLAVKKTGAAQRVRAYARRAETRDHALRAGHVDDVYDSAAQAVRGADLVVFCTPVLAIEDGVRECLATFDAHTLVTDVASTKGELDRALRPLFAESPAEYIGSHPLAGSDESGLEAARDDLYNDALVVVTPHEASADESTRRLCAFWESIQTRTVVASPDDHDRLVAATSHFPHLIASMLVAHVLNRGDASLAEFCGSGFRDMTRIAGGPDDVWLDIVQTNREHILDELRAFSDVVQGVRDMLENDDLDGIRNLLALSRRQRKELS